MDPFLVKMGRTGQKTKKKIILCTVYARPGMQFSQQNSKK